MSAKDNFVIYRRHKKGPSLNIAYYDIIIAPDDTIDIELLYKNLGVSGSDKEEETENANPIQAQSKTQISVERPR